MVRTASTGQRAWCTTRPETGPGAPTVPELLRGVGMAADKHPSSPDDPKVTLGG